MKLALFGIALYALSAASPAFARGSYFEDWEKNQAEMERQGYTKKMFLVSAIYLEGRYLAGFCSRHLSDHAIEAWDGLRDSDTPGIEAFRQVGVQQYQQGLRDGVEENPSEDVCYRTLDSFLSEQIAIQRYLDSER